ncbi:MAG: FimV/HubP family polar landmark protein, partial [Dokdonella sp.]
AVAAVAEPVQVERQPAIQAPPPPEQTTTAPVAELPAPVATTEREVPTPVQAPPARVEPSAPPIAVAPARAAPEVAAEPASQPARAAVAPSGKPLPPSVAASNGTSYGPVAAGETLWEIANATLPDDEVSANQLMLALLNANPQAFSKNNINRLKRGAILRIPSPEEIRAVGSMRVAAAQVRAQVEQWRGETTTPTLLAGSAAGNVGKPDFSTATSGPIGDDRLALVPPEMGKDGLASTGQAGSSAGTALGNATAADLARSNEELESRNQEAGELRSRVKDLEGIQTSNERLISLKDSEIADLQRKLAAAQAADQADATTSAPVAVEPATSVATASAANVAPVDGTLSEPAPSDMPVATAQDDIWGKNGKESAPPADAATPESPAVAGATDGQADTAANAGSTDPQATNADATALENPPVVASESTPVVETAAPVEATDALAQPAVTAAAPAQEAVVAETPWYLDPRVLGGTALIALLLGVLAVRSRRKTPAAKPKSSLADQFAAATTMTPVVAQPSNGGIVVMDEERQLAQQIAEDPADLGARLELISIYYADNRVDEFRTAALAMEPYVDDPKEAEWVQVRAMGEDLLPNDPLFSSVAVAQAEVAPASADDDWSDVGDAPVVDRMRWSNDGDDFDDVDRSEVADVDVVEAPVVAAADNELRFAPAPLVETGHANEANDANLTDDEFAPDDEPLASMDDDLDELDAKAAGGLEFTLEDAPELDEIPVKSASVTPVPDLQSTKGRPLTEVSIVDRPPTESFDFDLPPLEFESSVGTSSTIKAAAQRDDDASNDLADSGLDDEFLTGEDALGTKLDLARAYADMGDPEGARDMLEEVLSAGDSAQKDKARRLLAELG